MFIKSCSQIIKVEWHKIPVFIEFVKESTNNRSFSELAATMNVYVGSISTDNLICKKTVEGINMELTQVCINSYIKQVFDNDDLIDLIVEGYVKWTILSIS